MELRIGFFLSLFFLIILPASGLFSFDGMLTMSDERVLVILPVGHGKFHKGVAKYSGRNSRTQSSPRTCVNTDWLMPLLIGLFISLFCLIILPAPGMLVDFD